MGGAPGCAGQALLHRFACVAKPGGLGLAVTILRASHKERLAGGTLGRALSIAFA
jgi:hypothetical protein